MATVYVARKMELGHNFLNKTKQLFYSSLQNIVFFGVIALITSSAEFQTVLCADSEELLCFNANDLNVQSEYVAYRCAKISKLFSIFPTWVFFLK